MLHKAGFVNQAANIMQCLRDLARLGEDLRKLAEGTPEYDEHKKKIARVREPLPTSILVHYDKRLDQGKLGVAPVHRGVCGACYLTLPSGRLADLRRKPRDLNVCDHCGAFIYLAESEREAAGSSGEPSASPTQTALKRKSARAKRS